MWRWALGLAAVMVALSSASHADGDLVAKRQGCRAGAQAQITIRGQIGAELYGRFIERRQAYVRDCMDRPEQLMPPVPPLRQYGS